MNGQVVWLRLSYWIGAIADAFFAVAMVYTPLLQFVLGAPEGQPSVATRSALGMSASLMIGWSALLLWANERPVERKGVLLITVFPVIAGLSLATLFGMTSGYIPFANAISLWLFQALLVLLFLFSYYRAENHESAAA